MTQEKVTGRRAGASYRVSPALAFWVFLGALANLPSAASDPPLAQVAVGLAGLLHCILAFWRDGGHRITAPGVYLIASGLFAFFPAIYLAAFAPTTYPNADTLLATNIAYWVQLILVHFFWETRRTPDVPVEFISDRRVTHWGAIWGIILIAGGTFAASRQLGGESTLFVDAAVFAGIVLLATALFRREGRISVLPYLLVLAALIIYMEFVFTGFGRLRIGALGIAVIIALAPRWKRLPKVALLLAFPPVLAYLAADRVEFTASLNPAQGSNVTGLESVISPFGRFSQLLTVEGAGELMHHWGSSFVAAVTVLVPRWVWPDKPVGLGVELATYFRPELVGVGHSELALFYGEWIWSFGFLGLVLMVPVIGFLVRALDSALIRSTSAEVATRRTLLMVTMLIILAASIVDLFWGGAHAYAARVGPRILILGIPLVLGGMHKYARPATVASR